MKATRCPTCFLRQVIGPAADSLTEQETLVLLDTVKRTTGIEFTVTVGGRARAAAR